MINSEYKETTINSAFNTINTNFSEIFNNATKEKIKSYSRRWVWELIQNSYDTETDAINIEIAYDSIRNTVSFCHDGKSFNKRSLMSLITQISEKIDCEDKAGQFGTGFTTTHLLSKNVKISGTYCNKFNKLINFDFILKRDAWKANTSSKEFVSALKEQIRENLDDLDNLEIAQSSVNLTHKTEFTYFLTSSETKEAVSLGIKDLINHMPVLLAFNDKIKSIIIDGVNYSSEPIHCRYIESIDIKPSQFRIYKNTEYICDVFSFKFNNDKKEISIGVCNNNNNLIPYPENTARIFCRFPLVGSENFGIPFVVNSKLFQVNEKRDSIQQSNEINKNLLNDAIILYDRSINYLVNASVEGLQYFCIINGKNENMELSNQYLKKSKEIYSNKEIVKTLNGHKKTLAKIKIPFLDSHNFPKEIDEVFQNKIQEEYFKLVAHCNDFEIPEFNLCRDWFVAYKESTISLEELAKEIASNETILKKLDCDWVEWLNNYIKILIRLHKVDILKSSRIFVNQKGYIISLDKHYIDTTTDDKLKEIYNGFLDKESDYIQNKLIFRNLGLGDEIFRDLISQYTDVMIAREISNNVISILAKERGGDNCRDDKTQDVFNKLFFWMKANEDKARLLFNSIFDSRMSLCSNKIQIENYNMAEEAKKFLADNKVSSFQEMVNKKLVEMQQYQIALENEISKILSSNDITEEMILEFLRKMSISCEDELKNLLKASGQSAEKIKKFLEYRSTGLQKCYLKVQEMLCEAFQRVKTYQQTKGYDWIDSKKIAPTVYDGIKKQKEEVVIVIRPSNNEKVIFYYDSEPNYLRKNYELWVVDTDNQNENPRQLTLGDILKVTGIKVIPLKNLF